jgi:hypothetical protein
LTDAEIDNFTQGLEGNAQSDTFAEFPGQNPRTGTGMQDITERINPNPQQIAQNVNHYFSDVGNPIIADAADVPIGAPRGECGSVIPDGVGVEADPVPQTNLQNADGSPVLNEGGDPIGNSNVEARAHSADPKFPNQGPRLMTNTPSDRFGWRGDRTVEVGGETGRYLLPDGTWVDMATLQAQIRAARAAEDVAELARLNQIAADAHWPIGG